MESVASKRARLEGHTVLLQVIDFAEDYSILTTLR